jgi:hypothetical protein
MSAGITRTIRLARLRSFLVSLAVVGIGSAIAMRLSESAANAVPKTEIASGAKDFKNSETLPESKTAEVVEKVDPNDPLTHFNQPITATVDGSPAGYTGEAGG